MTQETFSTEEVRHQFIAQDEQGPWGPGDPGYAEDGAEFDKWLAQHDAEVAAQALVDAAEAMQSTPRLAVAQIQLRQKAKELLGGTA